jgi:putative ABC transport system permease protein
MWTSGLVKRRRARMAGTTIGVALLVAFLASLGAFFTAARAHMTKQALVGVPVDWQVQLSSGSDLSAAEGVIRAQPGVVAELPVFYGDTTGFQASAGGTTQTTGPGEVLGLPPGYAAKFPGEIRYLVGAHEGVLLAQQTAANLHASVGSRISIGLPGAKPVSASVQGIIDLPASDSLFQTIGVPAGSSPTAPPDNVVLLPAATWQRVYAPVGRTTPSATSTQLHVNLAQSLPSDPNAAFAQVVGRAHNLEAKLAGGALVGDNLAVLLDSARQDALYAQLLFLFLGVPGAILTILLTSVIGASGADRRRREQALLRIRGAAPRRIVGLAAAEAALVGVVGCLIGLGGAALAGKAAFSGTGFGATAAQAIGWAVGACLVGLLTAFTTLVIPAWRDNRNASVKQGRATIGPSRRPLWSVLYLDVIALAAAGLLFWHAVRTGYQVILAPEGVATISVDYFVFLGPVLLWVGSALLSWRISNMILTRGTRPLTTAVRPAAGGLAGVVIASMARQRRLLSRGLVIMALTGSFAVSTALFNATYEQQSRVDAQLTNGADVSVTTSAETGLPAGLPGKVRALAGVDAAQPMEHRFAYVGNDLQDLYGIDPTRIATATNVSDAFFTGATAAQALALLQARPDAVLVSAETVQNYLLAPGDLIRLRLQFASDHRYHIVPFHYVGIIREFPTAPRDSFLVANASYVAKATGSAAYQTLLVRTSGSPPAVASAVRTLIPRGQGAVVQDIQSELKITLSNLTAIDLSGLTRLELAFAFLLAAAASGLVLGLGLAERRRTFAITRALGAKTRQLASFVWVEAAFVSLCGMVLGALAGWGVAFTLVKIMTGVFDPPPEHLVAPVLYLTILAIFTVAAVVAAVAWNIWATRKSALATLRDL